MDIFILQTNSSHMIIYKNTIYNTLLLYVVSHIITQCMYHKIFSNIILINNIPHNIWNLYEFILYKILIIIILNVFHVNKNSILHKIL